MAAVPTGVVSRGSSTAKMFQSIWLSYPILVDTKSARDKENSKQAWPNRGRT